MAPAEEARRAIWNIYRKFAKRINTEMVTVKTHGDRTLFFDFLPFDIGIINGYDVKIQLYTVPGQVKYNATRRLVLRGVDGIVFVADAMAVRREKNILSLKNLQENLAAYKKSIFKIPFERDLNSQLKTPSFPASAVLGNNVVATLKRIISLTVASIRNDLI